MRDQSADKRTPLVEDYQSLKRALLVYASGTVATYLLHANKEGIVSFFGLQIGATNLALLRLLLWAATTYYLLGYALAFRSLQRANNAALGGAYAKAELFEKAGNRLWALAGRVERVAEKWSDPIDYSPTANALTSYRQERFNREIDNILRDSISRRDAEALAARVSPLIRDDIKSFVERRIEAVEARVRELSDTIATWEEIRTDLRRTRTFVRDVHKLAQGVSIEEMLMLYGWDVLAVALMYTTASVAVYYPQAMRAALTALAHLPIH